MFSSQPNRGFQPPDSKFGSINSLPLITTTGKQPPVTPPPPIIKPEPRIQQVINPEPQITVEKPAEYKEIQIYYKNPFYDDINLEDIYTNYTC